MLQFIDIVSIFVGILKIKKIKRITRDDNDKRVYFKVIESIIIEAGRGAAAQRVSVKPTGCGFDPHSRR